MNKHKYKYKRSRQRELILKTLQNTDTHPTASWVYDELKKEFSNLSMGTVYRNINILIDQNLVTKIEAGSSFDRFDANVSPHYHFICRECSSVYDIAYPILPDFDQQVDEATDHKIEEHRINFYGRCKFCLEQNTFAEDRS